MKSQQSKESAGTANSPVAGANKRAARGGKKHFPNPAEPAGKLGKVIALLKRPKGATIGDLTKATGWQAHSVRGAISGAIKKKLKLAVTSEKTEDVRTY